MAIKAPSNFSEMVNGHFKADICTYRLKDGWSLTLSKKCRHIFSSKKSCLFIFILANSKRIYVKRYFFTFNVTLKSFFSHFEIIMFRNFFCDRKKCFYSILCLLMFDLLFSNNDRGFSKDLRIGLLERYFLSLHHYTLA